MSGLGGDQNKARHTSDVQEVPVQVRRVPRCGAKDRTRDLYFRFRSSFRDLDSDLFACLVFQSRLFTVGVWVGGMETVFFGHCVPLHDRKELWEFP